MMEGTTPWWMAGSAVAATIVLKGWDWFQQRRSLRAAEGGASTLIEGLTKRLQELEARASAMDARLNEEIRARVRAQEDAAMLRVRVLHLEQVMRHSGITVPATFAEAVPVVPTVSQKTGD